MLPESVEMKGSFPKVVVHSKTWVGRISPLFHHVHLVEVKSDGAGQGKHNPRDIIWTERGGIAYESM